VGDFNGDGFLDLAVANRDSGTVSVLLGNGDGTFQPAVNYAAGTEPISLVVGTFHDPTILDLAVANYRSGNVSVLSGNGDGTFRTTRNFAVGTYPASVAVADLNGDGIPDLVTANIGSDNLSVLLANGDGTFQPARNFPGGEWSPWSVAVGDFNSDGWPDVVTANYAGNDVSIRLNDGNWPASPGGAPGRGSKFRFGAGDGLFVHGSSAPVVAPGALDRVAPYRPSVDESSTASLLELPGLDAFFTASTVVDRRGASDTWLPPTRLAVEQPWWVEDQWRDVSMGTPLSGKDG
jgi:hypothetical protein